MWIQILSIAILYLVIIGLISYAVYEIAKGSRRKSFLNEVTKLVTSDLEDDTIVDAIYHQTYHYMQTSESVRSALTYVLNGNTENASNERIERIMRLIDKNGEVSALMSLPDPIRPVMPRVYNLHASAKNDIAHVAWLIKDLEIRSGNKKVLAKIFGFVTAGVTLISVTVKFLRSG